MHNSLSLSLSLSLNLTISLSLSLSLSLSVPLSQSHYLSLSLSLPLSLSLSLSLSLATKFTIFSIFFFMSNTHPLSFFSLMWRVLVVQGELEDRSDSLANRCEHATMILPDCSQKCFLSALTFYSNQSFQETMRHNKKKKKNSEEDHTWSSKTWTMKKSCELARSIFLRSQYGDTMCSVLVSDNCTYNWRWLNHIVEMALPAAFVLDRCSRRMSKSGLSPPTLFKGIHFLSSLLTKQFSLGWWTNIVFFLFFFFFFSICIRWLTTQYSVQIQGRLRKWKLHLTKYRWVKVPKYMS